MAESKPPEDQRICKRTMYLFHNGGKMNEQYWQDLLDGKVGEGYFTE